MLKQCSDSRLNELAPSFTTVGLEETRADRCSPLSESASVMDRTSRSMT
jgi:hypothetical protein